MPWEECHVMDERLRFVARLLEGEKMAPLCAEFGISRKTGYKIFDRYRDCGVQPLAIGATARTGKRIVCRHPLRRTTGWSPRDSRHFGLRLRRSAFRRAEGSLRWHGQMAYRMN
jgi:transposase